MSRLGFFLLGSSLLAAGCAHKDNNAQQSMAPPPGWTSSPPPGAVVAPAPSGCSSCQGSNPVVNAPRYTPPMPAAPPLTSNVPVQTVVSPVVVQQSAVVTAQPAGGPIQAAFKPSIPYLESAKLGVVQIDETPAIPVPPTDTPEANTTSTPARN